MTSESASQPLRPLPSTAYAARTILDHLVVDRDEMPIGRVDDLELRVPGPGGAPVIAALLLGPLALGPRLGGRLGTWWLAVGRRLRPEADPQPVRIPMELVTGVRPGEVHIGVRGADVGADRLRSWVREKIIAPLPGGGAAP
jgi:hypothetical protein